jgi:hypothetical protein
MFISIFAGRLDAEGQTEAWSARLVEVEDPTVGEDLDPSPGPLLRTAAQPADEIQAAGYARRLAEAQPGAVDR